MGPVPSATPQPFSPGTVVGGKYRLRRRLAAGGAGEVWVARNEATRAKVALKVLRHGTTATLDAVERFRQEARIGGMLSHRNIVRVFDLIEQKDGTLVLVMELLAGETLASYLKRRAPLPPREAVAMCLPILAALRHAHEQKVLHRDISPRNIFLVVEPDGHVVPKLVDFGLAKAPSWEFKTVEGSVLGTPSYMSPEQIRAEPDLDGRTDVYGLAAVLYEMLTASPPYRGPNPMATHVAALEAAEPARRDIDERMWLVLRGALSKTRAERPSDAQAFGALLVAAVSGSDQALALELNHTSAVIVGDEVHDELASEEAKPEGSFVQLTPGVATAFGPGVPRAQAAPSRAAVPLAAILALTLVAAIAIVALASVATRSATSAPAAAPIVATAAGASRGPRDVDGRPLAASSEIERGGAGGHAAAPAMAAPSPSAAATLAVPSTRPRPVATTPGF